MTMPLLAPPPRVPDWLRRLNALCTARLDAPFAWHTNDCASFLADAVQAQHGRDTLAALRVPRPTARAARRALGRSGGAHAVMAAAGLPPVPPALAQRGDAVLLRQPTHGRRQRLLVGVCMGAWAVAPGCHGLASVPMAQAVAAWRV